MIITLPINNKVIGVVDVPETIKHSVSSDNRLLYLTHPATPWKSIDLPPGNWQILGRASEITESQAREIVEIDETAKDFFGGECEPFRDYEDTRSCFSTALDSFQSFLKANQINETDLILIHP